jgi:hypothetical protein
VFVNQPVGDGDDEEFLYACTQRRSAHGYLATGVLPGPKALSMDTTGRTHTDCFARGIGRRFVNRLREPTWPVEGIP